MFGAVIISWCWSNSGDLTNVGIDGVEFSIPLTYEKQVPQESYNTKLGSRPVLVFAQEWETKDSFTKNILVTKTAFNPQISTLEASTAVMVDSIQATFGSYEQQTLRTRKYDCNWENKPSYLHTFAIGQWNLQATQQRYIAQYYFVESNWIYVVSGISDDIDDISNYESYFKTLKCKPLDNT